jgi:flagellar hook-associated protein 3 FlgL
MSNIGRISTNALHTRTMSNFARVQEHLATLQNQISSGIKANTFEGLTGQVEQFVGLEAKVGKLKSYINNNIEVQSRMQSTRQAVANTIDITDSMKNLLMLRRNGAIQDNLAFSQQITSMRESFINQLNQNVNGRYLFGGTRSDHPPVSETIPALAENNVPDAGYYQGSTEDIFVRPQDNYEFAYNVRADAEGFQKVFAAISMGLDGDADNDDAKIAKALEMMNEGLNDINIEQTKLDANIVDIDQINERHNSAILYYKGVTEEIAKTDIVTASTEVTLDQTILSATFQTFARISSLNLADYLK